MGTVLVLWEYGADFETGPAGVDRQTVVPGVVYRMADVDTSSRYNLYNWWADTVDMAPPGFSILT